MANFKKYYFSIVDGRYKISSQPSQAVATMLSAFIKLFENESFRSISWKVDEKHKFVVRFCPYKGYDFVTYIF